GHLSLSSIVGKSVGDVIKKGECIGYLGNEEENGSWSPHLHFQLMLSVLDYKDDFPGVAYPSEIAVWKSICPNPNLLFKLHGLEEQPAPTNEELISYRKTHLGKSLSLQYKVPIKMVRGAGAYLVDQYGNKYLDTVNNVAHVGHEHPDVVAAGQQQMSLLNTNSRYLHENINALAKALIETLPPELSVLHFVNSGSEANELAIRMAKASTGQQDIIASQVGYHGNTNICVDISSYKFDGNGGGGAPRYTHIFPLPDTFRGKYTGTDAGAKYAEEVQKQIDKVASMNRKVAALIIESIISCGGQIELPSGFLADAFQRIRAAGGICISDEVQVGCGRTGKHFWGFQLYDVVPDIVTIGKPLGNGHPLAAVACTRAVADSFANGMEYFNTFGGNPVSCAIGTAVLQTVKREDLQSNALTVGNYLKNKLVSLSEEYPIIGDVRGQGLFLGIELVDRQRRPLGAHADYLANRMKDHRILMSTDGPDHNVLKIKPPMVFSMDHADLLLRYLKKIIAEDFMKNY
ncbi:MAG: aminotransferase class III-fold pyridoxal phosphate-dependent enzyme, partial [Bacteroidota bacterium]